MAAKPSPFAPAASPFGAPAASPFGAPAASPFGAPAASPFGAPAAASPFAPRPPAASPFGAPAPSPFAAPAAYPYAAPAAAPAPPPPQLLAPQTKFNDLPDATKAEILKFHAYFKSMQEDSHELGQATEKIRDEHPKIREDLLEMSKRFSSFQGTLQQGLGFVSELVKDVSRQQQSIQTAREIFQGTRQTGPAQQRCAQLAHAFLEVWGWESRFKAPDASAHPVWGSFWELTRFWDLTRSFEERMRDFASAIDELERQVRAPEDAVTAPQNLPEILTRLHESFMYIAGEVAKVHDDLQGQKAIYLSMLRRVQPEARNPFDTPAPDTVQQRFLLPNWPLGMPGSLGPLSAAPAPAAPAPSAPSSVFGVPVPTATPAAAPAAAASAASPFGAPAAAAPAAANPFGAPAAPAAAPAAANPFAAPAAAAAPNPFGAPAAPAAAANPFAAPAAANPFAAR
ncbi:hypothetical protein PAPYR_8975 [Paratrimastix pyriformis]|uniref:Uncharacterized protein n=1 Tax=Paratrimastix pyriformis TaxID=342808 RepID=A0ABQ8U9G1_9EUKA|nr:hypothetical protein PAPYR_8975 [Paratrimastix pyriformis]